MHRYTWLTNIWSKWVSFANTRTHICNFFFRKYKNVKHKCCRICYCCLCLVSIHCHGKSRTDTSLCPLLCCCCSMCSHGPHVWTYWSLCTQITHTHTDSRKCQSCVCSPLFLSPLTPMQRDPVMCVCMCVYKGIPSAFPPIRLCNYAWLSRIYCKCV